MQSVWKQGLRGMQAARQQGQRACRRRGNRDWRYAVGVETEDRKMLQELLAVVQLCYLAECTRSDIRTGYISVGFSLLCAAAGCILRFITQTIAAGSAITETAVPVLLRIMMDLGVGIFAMVIAFFSRGMIGMGDAWMLLVTGLICGRERAVYILWIALLIGGAYGIFDMRVRKKKKTDTFPFAPCLLAAYLLRGCT